MNVFDIPAAWNAALEAAVASPPVSLGSEQTSIRYVSAPEHGWIRVYENYAAPQAGAHPVSLADRIKVQFVKTTKRGAERFDTFRVLESCNNLQNKTVSAFWVNDKSPLSDGPAHGPAIRLRLDRRAQKLYEGESFLADAFTEPAQLHDRLPLTTGGKGWKLMLPDAPHQLGSSYGPLGVTWFRIETDPSDVYTGSGLVYGVMKRKGERVDDRYLHCGTRSHGCATVGLQGRPAQQVYEAWKSIYARVIGSRELRDGGCVGTLEVFESGAG